MTALYWTFLILLVSTASLADERSVRGKRNVFDLGGVIKCTTGREASSYLGYGCHCGLGGNGSPKDQTDWCCRKHDCCYDKVNAAGCRTLTNKYRWTCTNNQVNCGSITDRCDKILCQCDSEFGQCIRNAPYNKKYAFWSNLLCHSSTPGC
ncbi:phospholipase A2-like isoform 2-T2 [Clarias gariepinus]